MDQNFVENKFATETEIKKKDTTIKVNENKFDKFRNFEKFLKEMKMLDEYV